jgi:ribose-phosphate pyrophosphokinase
MILLGFPDYQHQTCAIADALSVPFQIIDVHHFPDGESRLRLPPDLPERIVLCRSLDRPNSKLVELLIAAECARDQGATHLTLIAPYLCYMRQDMAFHRGEAVSQRYIGRFLAGLFDAIITVDPHLHRVHSLAEAVPVQQAVVLSAASTMGSFLTTQGEHPLLVGPDSESEQWVRAVAERASLDYVVAKKRRCGDRNVEISLPTSNYAGLDAVLVDDVVSSGVTLATAARALREAGIDHVDVLVSHALFSSDAIEMLRASGVRDIWSSDSIPHPTNAFTLAPLLAAALR